MQTLWNNVLAQFVCVDNASNRPAGLVFLYAPDLRNGHARIAGSITQDQQWRHGLEAFGLLIDYAFEVFPLRKIYAEVFDFNLSQFSSLIDRRLFVEEGRLRQHEFMRGAYHDMVYLALYKETWLTEGRGLLRGTALLSVLKPRQTAKGTDERDR